jgi:hypothetical protein
MELHELDTRFSHLTDLTDRISLINSPYESDLDGAFHDLFEFLQELQTISLDDEDSHVRHHFLAHLTFHREMISDIIDEARSLLMDDRREYLRKLVEYRKQIARWINEIEKSGIH